ncbi:MAG: hypothetical protein K8R67_07540 [Desulfobacteraceae bacterium]|nr:hypothetical protein [Desulfobacteraceae bacterium]
MSLDDITTEQLVSKVRDTLPEGKGDIIMTLAEQLRNEGREKWLGQGLEQGLEFAIDMKYGDTPDTKSAISIIKNIKNIHQLKAVQKSIKKAKTASELISLISMQVSLLINQI